jgi:hypothetical protein
MIRDFNYNKDVPDSGSFGVLAYWRNGFFQTLQHAHTPLLRFQSAIILIFTLQAEKAKIVLGKYKKIVDFNF